MTGETSDTCFSWLSFLLGLAIGLWIAVVALFLLDSSTECDCGPPGTTIIAQPVGQAAWIPAGDSAYYCANDDQGSALVVDQGRAIVVDQGRSIVVDQGGAIVVDQGSAIIVDAGPLPPAPDDSAGQLGRQRNFEEFACETNDQGGAIVVDRAKRLVAVGMPNGYPSARCGSVNGNAIVVNEDGKRVIMKANGEVDVIGQPIEFDSAADAGDDQVLPDQPRSSTDLAYCVVASGADFGNKPIVIRPTGP